LYTYHPCKKYQKYRLDAVHENRIPTAFHDNDDHVGVISPMLWSTLITWMKYGGRGDDWTLEKVCAAIFGCLAVCFVIAGSGLYITSLGQPLLFLVYLVALFVLVWYLEQLQLNMQRPRLLQAIDKTKDQFREEGYLLELEDVWCFPPGHYVPHLRVTRLVARNNNAAKQLDTTSIG
ncbi:MAG: hypothetical protein SGILL_008028, partial [Bacillariaceae sp.]